MLHNYSGKDPNDDDNISGGGFGNGNGSGSAGGGMPGSGGSGSAAGGAGGSGSGSGSGSGGPGGPGGPGGRGGMGIPMFSNGTSGNGGDVPDILVNYNEKFKNATPTLFRDDVIRQTISCLISMIKANALLVGAAGVGKTKIVEDIARRIAQNDASIPDNLKDYTIWELPLAALVANTGIRGQLEEKVNDVIDYMCDKNNKAILFIDEIHRLVDSHDTTYQSIAQIFKPALARGDLKCIGATTLQESKSLKSDPAFERRFTRVIVDELSKEQTFEILQMMAGSFFDHYQKKLQLNDDVLNETVKISAQYCTGHRPDNAITLLDRSLADTVIRRKRLELQAKTDPTVKALIDADPNPCLTIRDVKKTAIKLSTGNSESHEFVYADVKAALEPIKGQDDVIEEFLTMLDRDSLNLYPRTKPMTILFTGNSGVGKTEIVKKVAKEMTGQKPIILNMTEYADGMSLSKLIGSSKGYVGSEDNDEMPFDILESNPFQIILLDEFEKANRAVQRLFMQVFEEGVLTTARGKELDFSKAIIIATTNAGHTNKSNPIGFNVDEDKTASVSELGQDFDMELLNRFGKVLNFHAISKETYREIVADIYRRDVADIKAAHSSIQYLNDELSDDELDELVKKSYQAEFGARPAKKAVQAFIEDIVISKRH